MFPYVIENKEKMSMKPNRRTWENLFLERAGFEIHKMLG
jgi:hypothetical protein